MIYLAYKDNGPTGICGQTTNITSNWQKLYRFTSLKEALDFMNKFDRKGRKKVEFIGPWTDDGSDKSYLQMIEDIR